MDNKLKYFLACGGTCMCIGITLGGSSMELFIAKMFAFFCFLTVGVIIFTSAKSKN